MIDIDPELLSKLEKLIPETDQLANKQLELLDKYKKAYKSLTGREYARKATPFDVSGGVGGLENVRKVAVSIGALVLKDVLAETLREKQIPLRASALREAYNAKTKKNLSKVGFSPNLSSATKTTIKKYVLKSAPHGQQHYYGLPEWFEGEELKQEYKDKIRAV